MALQRLLFEENLQVHLSQKSSQVGMKPRPTLTALYDHQDYGISNEARNQKVKALVLRGLVEMVFTGILASVILAYRDPAVSWIDAATLSDFSILWIYVYFGIYVLYLLRRIVLILQWKCAADPRIKQARFNFFTYIFISTPEYAWLIVGHTKVFWGKHGLYNQSPSLFYTMLSVIIYSYFHILVYSISLLLILVLLLGLFQYGMFDRKG